MMKISDVGARVGRRDLLRAGGVLAAGACWPAWAQSGSPGLSPRPVLSGEDVRLRIAHQVMTIDGRPSHAIGINGSAPAPLIRLREGQNVRLHVENALDEETSLHWHGLLVPFHMDGVPGVSFPGIAPRSTFTYEFQVRQSGTYWYHSHSGLQEQLGLYGPIVIDPAGADPVEAAREHVILLSDHSQLHPHTIFRKLKQQGGYFNFQKQTLAGLLAGHDQRQAERLAWGKMRMDPADVADVTASTYTYLVNGHGPRDHWTGLFAPGERVRLRLVNASAMTTFNVRLPGLAMSVVQADGLPVRPVEVDELQIAVAETYDVIVTPRDDRAYALVAESVDRSGMALATLAPRAGMRAAAPPLRPRPLASMKDMGMGAMGASDGHAMAGHDMAPHDMTRHDMTGHDMAGGHMGGHDDGTSSAPSHDMSKMDHSMRDFANAPEVKRTATVQTIAPMPVDRTGEPGQGLSDVGHRVLTYRDLVAVARNPDVRAPDRSLRIHLTGNMERYMWAFDGEKLNEVTAPFAFLKDERVRVTLVNDTMMGHPIHLHGHFFELVTGHGDHAPRKHTVQVQPGGTVTFDVTTDTVGDWAFHCHMLYHMHAGMMQVVTVRPRDEATA